MERPPHAPIARRRRSRGRRGGVGVLRAALALLLTVILGAAGFAAWRAVGVIRATTASGNPLSELAKAGGGVKGTIPYKLQHGQQVNILLLGYGGSENDAPWLTDTIVDLSIDPTTKRVFMVSIPRDLIVPINAFTNGKPIQDKINVAYEIGMDDADWTGKLPQFQAANSPDAGGRLSMQTVSYVTGLSFDGFVGVDFQAFRDLVNALGGVQICLTSPLDDYQYPNYKDGYVPGGIHFKAGCQAVNGEQALELARSRHAIEASQASDFARAARQRQLLDAIRQKAISINALARLPSLLAALQKNVITDQGLADLDALYRFAAHLPGEDIRSAALTDTNLVAQYYEQSGSCGPLDEYVLCPLDPSFQEIHHYFQNLFVNPKVLAEKAPVQLVNASLSLGDMGQRVADSLSPLGFQMSTPLRASPSQQSVIYDYSNGRYPLTVKWLASYFGASVVVPTAATPPPTPGVSTDGIVVVLGHQFALSWIGQ